MKTCKQCGFQNEDNRTMCYNCGSTNFVAQQPTSNTSGRETEDTVVPPRQPEREHSHTTGKRREQSRSNTSRTAGKVEWWPELPDKVKTGSMVALALVGAVIVAYIIFWQIPDSLTTVKKVDNLMVYTPHYSHVEFVVESEPSPDNDSIIFCAAASLTGEKSEEFKHNNIAGNHVSDGMFYNGYKSPYNTGVFTLADGEWTFGMASDADSLLLVAARKDGIGFMHDLLIYNGAVNSYRTKNSRPLECRALCDLDGKLRVIDSAEPMLMGDYVNALLKIGVKNAICMQMNEAGGKDPWNHSWYRTTDRPDPIFIQDKQQRYGTNWLTFYK